MTVLYIISNKKRIRGFYLAKASAITVFGVLLRTEESISSFKEFRGHPI